MPKFTDEPGPAGLLAADEPSPVLAERLDGRSRFVLVIDHASARIPRSLGNLGLPPAQLQRHIAWDIGSLAVAQQVAEQLDAPLVAQGYSRLVIDCNRNPQVADSIPTRSEWTEIPGNSCLSEAQIVARRAGIFEPYHHQVRALLDTRLAMGISTVLIALHSMTDVFKGVRREMHGAVLYNRDRRFAGLLLDCLRREPGLVIADNEPYFVSDDTDYTIPHHGEARGLLHVEIEMRQDLVKDAEGQTTWAERLVIALRAAERELAGVLP